MRLMFLAVCLAAILGRPQPVDAASWLVVSDIHFNPLYHPASRPGSDTQRGLLDSMFEALHAAEPRPPVVIIAGDFLAHGFYGWDAAPTMRYLAHRFNQTFPHAQFVIALGNNDAECADYSVTPDGPFLHAVAQAWAPLVNRNGAAPDFARTFARDGSYVASLPIRGVRAVVINDVFLTPRYRNRCGTGPDPAPRVLSEVPDMLRSARPGSQNWLILHVPPGVDVFSTRLTHGLFVVPFLRTDAEARLEQLIDDPQDRVAIVIAAHTHKFAYRLIDAAGPRPVPVLLAPSVSPIFYNAPSFVRLVVDGRGAIPDVTEVAFDWKRWRPVGGLRSLGVAQFTAPALLQLQQRMKRDSSLRRTFARLYDGAGATEITEADWRDFWCAAGALTASAYAACTRNLATAAFAPRSLELGAALVVALIAGAIVAAVATRRVR